MWKVFMSKTTSSLWKSSLDGLASSHILRLTLLGPPKILLYCTEYNRPTTLPLVRKLKTITVNSKESSIIEEIFDKTSEHIARLVNKCG
jgi:hypothetical protein